MKRVITSHIVEGDTQPQLLIEAADEPGQGGANHEYRITYEDKDGYVHCTTLDFQNGPIKEFGINGVTNEAFLDIVADRLSSFQKGPFACEDNEHALNSTIDALYYLQQRTRERIKRGVEGTNQK